MNTRERAELFTQYVGLELKGTITTHQWTAQRVAQTLGHSASALNGWLNGKRELPLSVLCSIAETIGAEPQEIVETAYNRMINQYGEVDGTVYEDAAAAEEQMHLRDVSRGVHDEADNITALPIRRSVGRNAANRRTRKSDEPHAE